MLLSSSVCFSSASLFLSASNFILSSFSFCSFQYCHVSQLILSPLVIEDPWCFDSSCEARCSLLLAFLRQAGLGTEDVMA